MRHAAAMEQDVVWVATGGRTGTAQILDACLSALDVVPAPGETRAEALRHALDGSDRLLVVDNLVPVEDLGRELQHLLELTSDFRLAVTTPEPLGGASEHVVRVPPLPVPPSGEPVSGPCLELLLARVRKAGGHPIDVPAHHEKLRALLVATGGLPLLIEQVAAQVAVAGLASVTPPTSVADAVDAAYARLDEDQRRCFRRLSLLPDPVSADVLAAIGGLGTADAASVAATLTRRNLVELLPDDRFDVLSPIRARARELADAEDEERTRSGLLRWADAVAPAHDNQGAGDAPWLVDVSTMRTAIHVACESEGTRDLGYALANRAFSSLYTAMHAGEAVEILETALASGDGPGSIGAQVARRAGIAASEVRGTYEGMWLIDRADEHASRAESPSLELARNASIRAEMHLDAGDFSRAESEARRAMDLHPTIARQASRTLVDVLVSRGDLAEAVTAATGLIALPSENEERWITLSARTLLARVALEQGRGAEAAAAARAVAAEARELAEDRVGLLAQTLLRQVDPSAAVSTVDRTTLPWAVRLPVLTQDARDLLDAGHAAHAAGLAADVVVLADSSCLGRDAVESRLLLAHALLARGETGQAASTFLTALERAASMPMPLRAADALDGLAVIAADGEDSRTARTLAATAAELRRSRQASAWGLAAAARTAPGRSVPGAWIRAGHLTEQAVHEISGLAVGAGPSESNALAALTRAERQVAERVADGLTSRQIAEELFVSPRTVDTHLAHIYRKLEISGRARLAALVADLR